MIEITGNDLVIIASNPQEMAEAQQTTIAKVQEKERNAEIERRQALVAIPKPTKYWNGRWRGDAPDQGPLIR